MANLAYTYKYYYIYKIVNLVNKKCYVGFHATNNEYEKDTYYGSGKLLNNAIKKYGVDNFVMGIIEYINVKDWKEKEMYWIKEMKSHVSENGYNMTYGGDGTIGLKLSKETKLKISYIQKHRSEETKKKISAALTGKHHTEETKEKIRNKNKQNQKLVKLRQTAFLGKHHTEETKEKISLIHKGKKLSYETKRKIHDALINTNLSEETKEKISNSNKGKIRSSEAKEKYSLSKKGIKRSVKLCPYCNKYIPDGNYTRWHGDNCKYKK